MNLKHDFSTDHVKILYRHSFPETWKLSGIVLRLT